MFSGDSAGRLGRHGGVDFVVEPHHLAGNVHVQRAAAARPAIDFEIDRDVIGEVIAVEVNLRGGDLHAVARRHAHAAFGVRLLRVAVELRLRADQLVGQSGRPVDRHLHVLERVPARLKRDDALGADARGHPAVDRLRVLERHRGRWPACRWAASSTSRPPCRPCLVRFSAPPVDGDHEHEGDEDEGKRYAKDADRALHGAGNLLMVKGIPISQSYAD